jgi:hypothetical protein
MVQVAQLGFRLTIDSGLPVAINERHPDSFRDSACIVYVLLVVVAVNVIMIATTWISTAARCHERDPSFSRRRRCCYLPHPE